MFPLPPTHRKKWGAVPHPGFKFGGSLLPAQGPYHPSPQPRRSKLPRTSLVYPDQLVTSPSSRPPSFTHPCTMPPLSPIRVSLSHASPSLASPIRASSSIPASGGPPGKGPSEGGQLGACGVRPGEGPPASCIGTPAGGSMLRCRERRRLRRGTTTLR